MGVEPTHERASARATVLKTASNLALASPAFSTADGFDASVYRRLPASMYI